MPYLKLTGNEKIQLDKEEAEKLQHLLLNEDAPKYVQVQGETIKTSNIIGVFIEQGISMPAYLEFNWTDDELLQWEKEIFGEGELIRDTFKQYLIDLGIISIKDIIKQPEKYRELTAKWDALNDLRYRNETKTGYKGGKEWIKKIRSELAEKLSIKKQNPTTSAIPDPYADLPEDEKRERERKLNEIPF